MSTAALLSAGTPQRSPALTASTHSLSMMSGKLPSASISSSASVTDDAMMSALLGDLSTFTSHHTVRFHDDDSVLFRTVAHGEIDDDDDDADEFACDEMDVEIPSNTATDTNSSTDAGSDNKSSQKQQQQQPQTKQAAAAAPTAMPSAAPAPAQQVQASAMPTMAPQPCPRLLTPTSANPRKMAGQSHPSDVRMQRHYMLQQQRRQQQQQQRRNHFHRQQQQQQHHQRSGYRHPSAPQHPSEKFQQSKLRLQARQFPCSNVKYMDQVTPEAKLYLKKQYAPFVPAPLPAPRRSKKPLCLFVNYLGTRGRPSPPTTQEQRQQAKRRRIVASSNPTDPPSGSDARCTFEPSSSNKKMRLSEPTDYFQ